LNACQGFNDFSYTYPWVTLTPSVLQLRAHPQWPTLHPAWPADISAVLADSTLLDQRTVVASSPTPNQPPAISISLNPSSSVTVGTSVTFTASTADSDGFVTSVNYLVNGESVGISTAGPTFPITWQPRSSGTFQIAGVATDNGSATATSGALALTATSATSVLTLSSGQTTCPDNYCILLRGTGFDGASYVDVRTLSGPDIVAQYVPGYSDLTLGTEGSLQTLWFSIATPSLRSLLDSEGLRFYVVSPAAGYQFAGPIVVRRIAANAPPAVNLTVSPAGALVAPAQVQLIAAANDNDGAVTRVDFLLGGTLLGSSSAAPYQITLANLAAGTYNFSANAIDNGGAVGVSNPVQVTVASAPQSGCAITVPPGGSIGSAVASVVPPATVCLQGSYTVAQSVNLRSGVTIAGAAASPSGAQVGASASLQGPMFRIPAGTTDVAIENLVAFSNGLQQAQLDAVIVDVSGASRVKLSKLEMSNTYRMTIAINQSSDVLVSESRFSGMGLQDCAACAIGSLWINDSNGVLVEDNVITGRNNGPGGDGGIDCYGSANVVVRRNNLSQTGESAIYSTFGAPGTTACRNISVTDNVITGSNEWGIDMRGLDGAYISGNRVERSKFGAMSMWDIANTQVVGNQMFSNRTSGDRRMCQGINRTGYQLKNTYTGNVGNGTILCNFNP